MPQAIPGVTSSSPPAQSRAGGFLRVVSPAQLNEQDRQKAAAIAAARTPQAAPQDDLGSYIRQRWMTFRNHRNQGNNPLNFRLLRAQRMFEGKYDPEKLAAIKMFGGSEVYSRIVAVKARGATSLLRDIYIGQTRPWALMPQEDPPVPPEVKANILRLLNVEVAGLQQSGQPIMEEQVRARYAALLHSAQQAARRQALMQTASASEKIEDILRAGGFYDALTQFLIDLPLFPFACMKGPTVKMVPKLTWVGSQPVRTLQPQMRWERVSPFDLYFSPGVSRIEDAEILERKRLTRADLNMLLGLPGYDQAAVRAVLQDYSRGLREWLDWPDMEQALNEGREDPNYNQTHIIEALEYTGSIQGQMLLDSGVDPRKIPDPDADYSVKSWVVGRHTLKTQINPSPQQRHDYFITAFEKVPGTVHGHGLPDILEDMQEIANATLRALVNNMGIASGPQVVINTDYVTITENEDQLYPWKRWKVSGDPLSSGQKPIDFFQPNSNVSELLAVYNAVNNLADDLSAIPRYLTGESLSGGAGRTASGLSMLMGNAQKVLQTVAANIDTDVMGPLLGALYEMIMLTDTTGVLSGDEQIVVNGVNVALAKDVERQKRLQFLQITANPIDMDIVGKVGRARVLRSLAEDLGMPDDIVPSDQDVQSKVDAEQKLAQAQAAVAAAHGGHPGQPGQPGAGKGAPAAPGEGKAQGGQNAPVPGPAQHADHAPPINNVQPQGATA